MPSVPGARLQTQRQAQIAPIGAERHDTAARLRPMIAVGAMKPARREYRNVGMRRRHAERHDAPGGGAFRARHHDVVEIAEVVAAVVAEAAR